MDQFGNPTPGAGGAQRAKAQAPHREDQELFEARVLLSRAAEDIKALRARLAVLEAIVTTFDTCARMVSGTPLGARSGAIMGEDLAFSIEQHLRTWASTHDKLEAQRREVQGRLKEAVERAEARMARERKESAGKRPDPVAEGQRIANMVDPIPDTLINPLPTPTLGETVAEIERIQRLSHQVTGIKPPPPPPMREHPLPIDEE